MRKKQIISALLCAVMLLSLFPALPQEAEAKLEITELDVDVSTVGQYVPMYLGTGKASARFVNGSLYYSDEIETCLVQRRNSKNEPKTWGMPMFGLEQQDKIVYWTENNRSVKGTLNALGADDVFRQEDVDDYNMMKCFGKVTAGKVVESPAEGFYCDVQTINLPKYDMRTGKFSSEPFSDPVYCNSVYTVDDSRGGDSYLINIGGYNRKSGTLRIVIKDNPTLREMAKNGELQMYYSGVVFSCVEQVKKNSCNYTGTTGSLTVTGIKGENTPYYCNTKFPFGQLVGYFCCIETLSTDGWLTLTEDSVITLQITGRKYFNDKEKRRAQGMANGIGNSILLFRDRTSPTLDPYKMNTNAIVSGNEALLGKDGTISLDLSFSEPIKTAINEPARNERSMEYALFNALGNHVLFKNTTGTGYGAEGEEVSLLLKSVVTPETDGDKEKTLTTAKERVEALAGAVKSLHYEWNAGEWDYYGNNAVPNAGDWAGQTHSNNLMNLMDKLAVASYHDLAGNPLTIYDGEPTEENKKAITYEKRTAEELAAALEADPLDNGKYKTNLGSDFLKGDLTLRNQVKHNIGNPFLGSETSSYAGYNFVIDTIPPHYSITSNAVQPQVLTGLTLNSGSEAFTVSVRFDEVVQLKKYQNDVSGTPTGYDTSRLYLVLSDGVNTIYAPYSSGNFSKEMNFTVQIPRSASSGIFFTEVTGTALAAAVKENRTFYKKMDDGSYEKTVYGESEHYYILQTPSLEVKGYCLAEKDLSGTVATITNVNITEKDNWYTSSVPGYNPDAKFDTLLTDKVGNELYYAKEVDGEDYEYVAGGQPIGTKGDGTGYKSSDGPNHETVSYDTTMSWAELAVDNESPDIQVTRDPARSNAYFISANDASGSGVFYKKNNSESSDLRQQGILYYLWVTEDELNTALNDLTANNYALVKQYSQTGKCEKGNKAYDVSIAQSGDSVTVPSELQGQAVYLLVFAADMTWDAATQRIQYAISNYNSKPGEYFDILLDKMSQNGYPFDSSAGFFTKANESQQPEGWATTDNSANYSIYYYAAEVNGDTVYTKLPAAAAYPAFTNETTDAGTQETTEYYQADHSYYDPAAIPQNDDVPENWEDEYELYDTISTMTNVYNEEPPAYEIGKYYSRSDYTALQLQPEDWNTSYQDCYTYTYRGYQKVSAISAPAFEPGRYYIKQETYTLLSAKPDDWRETFASYYYKDGEKYLQAGNNNAPEFVYGKYFSRNNDGTYSLLASKPANWNTAYKTYYMPADYEYTNEITGIPLWKEDLYYTRYQQSSVTVEEANQDPYNVYIHTGAETVESQIEGQTVSSIVYYRTAAEKYGPNFEELAAVYTKESGGGGENYALQSEEPADWKTNFTSYYYLEDPKYRPVAKPADPSEEKQTILVYTKIASCLTTKPADWEESYKNYYFMSRSTETSLAFEAGSFYVKDTDGTYDYAVSFGAEAKETYFALSDPGENFDSRNCYVLNSISSNDAPDFASGLYYAETYIATTTDISNSDLQHYYQVYYTREEGSIKPVRALVPAGTQIYEKRPDYQLLTEEPADWAETYMEYSRLLIDRLDTESAVTDTVNDKTYIALEPIQYPNYLPGVYYYKRGYKKLTEKPEGWEQYYDEYYYKPDANIEAYEKVSVTDGNRTTDYPSYFAGGAHYCGPYYSIGESLNTLTGAVGLNAAGKERRRNAFVDAISSAKSTQEMILVFRRFSEFYAVVSASDKELLTRGADADTWDFSKFTNKDSNWTFKCINTGGAAIGQVGETEGNETKTVKVTANVRLNGGTIAAVSYQFVDSGVKVTSESAGWKQLYNRANGDTYPVNSNFNITLHADKSDDDGDYDLYIKVVDENDLITLTKLTTVTLASSAGLKFFLSNPKGFSPYERLANLTVAFSGEKLSADSNLKLFYKFDKDPTMQPGDEGWTEVTGNALSQFTLPALISEEAETTTYYLHLKYSYIFSDDPMTEYQLRSYNMKKADNSVQITVAELGKESLKLRITPGSASSEVSYALTAEKAAPLPAAYQSVTAEETVEISNQTYPEQVWVWTKVNGVAQEAQSFTMPKNVPAPDAAVKVKRVYQDQTDKNYYAIVGLQLSESAMVAGAEYSYTTDGENWNLWTPFDSVVKVKLGKKLTGLNVMFKFRNGDNVTAVKDYRKLSITGVQDDGSKWAYVFRYTLQTVGTEDTVSLLITDQDGRNETVSVSYADIKDTDGRYDYKVGKDLMVQAVVSNFDDTPPLFALETTMGGGYRLTSPENITLLAVTFTPENPEHPVVEAKKSFVYSPTENGTLQFIFCDDAGNKATAVAVVTGIDNDPPAFDIVFKEAINGRNEEKVTTVELEEGGIATATTISYVYDAGNTIPNEKYTTVKYLTIEAGSSDIASVKVIDPSTGESNSTDITESGLFLVTENGKYTVIAADTSGNETRKTVYVNSIVSEEPAPTVTVVKTGAKSAVATISGKTLEIDGLRIYHDGDQEATVTDFAYSFTKVYTQNAEYTEKITDSLGLTLTYTVNVDCLDDEAPTFEKSDAVLIVTQNTKKTAANWTDWLIAELGIQDESSFSIRSSLNLQTAVLQSGAYINSITATDEAGNVSYATVTIYVMPATGMVVTDRKSGTLFCSTGASTATLNANVITLRVNRFDRMVFGSNRAAENLAVNSRATIECVVKKGSFREGNMKYFDLFTKPITYDRSDPANATAYISLNADELPTTGWYTIVIRNAEREREYTTFFIAKLGE